MARRDPSALRDEAARAVERGKLRQALELSAELEQRQPADPQWPKRIGEVQRRAGERAAAVVAFERAVDRYVQAGFVVQAIAVCKLILQLEPQHSATIDRLGRLAAPGPARADAPARPPMIRGAGLAAVPLAEVMPGAQPELLPGGERSGKIVIPLEHHAHSAIDAAIDAAEPLPPARAAADDAEARRALRTTPLLAGLAPAVLGDLIAKLALVDLVAGTVLFREGDPGGLPLRGERGRGSRRERRRRRAGAARPGRVLRRDRAGHRPAALGDDPRRRPGRAARDRP
jgi:hypothetical protein